MVPLPEPMTVAAPLVAVAVPVISKTTENELVAVPPVTLAFAVLPPLVPPVTVWVLVPPLPAVELA